jgi:hypothetical protein
MTDLKTQASALLESLETQSKQTQNFTKLELLILKTTQKLGQIAIPGWGCPVLDGYHDRGGRSLTFTQVLLIFFGCFWLRSIG